MVISAQPAVPSGGDEPDGRGVPAPGPDGTGDGQNLPLVDTGVLQDLEDQLGRADLATNFVKDYAALWDQRERRLAVSLADEDCDAALDAVISLRVSSAMVGARRLAGLAQALERAVRKGDLSRGCSVLGQISLHGRATVTELEIDYLRQRA
ncbi:Hpt domain-containing protein [Arthrobacter sp. PGP41]|uniref:Hpt domain-containing protein n=1 Tax=Arthrobacter sp. PGP41 TaxID=2079227 RepID=UPI001319E8A4|nr:Hpt domain-containing protein [Arthrobacter sp. PGP41]